MDIRCLEKKDDSPECSILAKDIYDTLTTDLSLLGKIRLLTKRGDNVSIVEFIPPFNEKGRNGLIISVQRVSYSYMSPRWMEIEREGGNNYEYIISTTYIDINHDGTREKNINFFWHLYHHCSIKKLISAVRRYVSVHEDWSMSYDDYAYKFTLHYEKNIGENSVSDWSESFNDYYRHFYDEYYDEYTDEYYDEYYDEYTDEYSDKCEEAYGYSIAFEYSDKKINV